MYAALPLFGAPFGPSEAEANKNFRESTLFEWLQVATLTAGFRPTGELPWHKFQFANLAFWTLAIEVQFYAVVWAAVRSGRRFYADRHADLRARVPVLPARGASVLEPGVGHRGRGEPCGLIKAVRSHRYSSIALQ